MTMGLLDVARAPHRANAAPAAADRLDHHARAVLSGEEDPGLLKAHRMGAAGASGTPQRAASALALALSPNMARCSGVGPIQSRSAGSQSLASSARSLTKP